MIRIKENKNFSFNLVLKAMLDDSPAVPALLTDYILKFICPTNLKSNENENKRPKSSPHISQRATMKKENDSVKFSRYLNQTIRAALLMDKNSSSVVLA